MRRKRKIIRALYLLQIFDPQEEIKESMYFEKEFINENYIKKRIFLLNSDIIADLDSFTKY
jgi:hypothetical protein